MRGCSVVILLILLTLGCAAQNHTAEGIRFFGQARYDAAMTSFRQALQANPDDPNALYNIAATYHQSARASLLLGQAASAQQQYEQAARYYQLSIARDPNHAKAFRGLAALYMDCQTPDAAFELLRHWSQANPVSAEPKLELARLYQEWAQIAMLQGRTEVAQQCRDATAHYLQLVLAREPSNYRALRALGFLKEQTGDIAGAVFVYHRSLQANPQQRDLEERIAVLTR
jgi:tetratricopeptide (TPR) repeat protein